MTSRVLLFSCLILTTSACAPSDQRTTSNLMSTAPSIETARSAIMGDDHRYPLALGTKWTYEVLQSQRFRADGDPDYGSRKSTRGLVFAEASRTTVIEGRTYTVIEELHYFPNSYFPDIPYPDQQYLRLDSSALYSYPHVGGIGAATSGDEPSPSFRETVLLLYPLRVGARWRSSLRSDYEFEVEAIEPVRTNLGTFPAARVRGFLHSGQPGTEAARIWYGKPGIVRRWEKRVDDAVLPTGQRGVRETVTDRLLTSFVPG